MSDAVSTLLAAAAERADRRRARALWVKETCARWREAQRRMDERLSAAVERLSEQAFERLFNDEQAKVDALLALLRLAAERDVWPRELYWGNAGDCPIASFLL